MKNKLGVIGGGGGGGVGEAISVLMVGFESPVIELP